MKKLSKKTVQLAVVGAVIAAVLAVGYVYTVAKKTPTAVVKTTVVDTVTTILKDSVAVDTTKKAVEVKETVKK